MRYLVIILMALSLTACKGKFIVESTGQPYELTVEKPCEMCGVCSYYKDGKYQFGPSRRCKGEMTVTSKITPQYGYYEKEPNIKTTKDEETIIRSGRCK